MNILIPQGIGDSVWAMFKIQGVAKKHNANKIDVLVACMHPTNEVEARAVDFIRRFKFINSAEMYCCDILNRSQVATPEGYYNYIPDGDHEDEKIDFVMMPNAPVERGIRIEDWLPEYETNWDAMDEWEFLHTETAFADHFSNMHGDYAVFFMGGKASNGTGAAHNRGPMWKPQDWIDLGNKLHELQGVNIVVVGAEYDRDYYRDNIEPIVKKEDHWIDVIGGTTVGEAIAIVKNSRYIISYQSGIAMVPNYLGTPAGIFWRPKGNSINPSTYISFEEEMSTAWVKPEILEKELFLPLFYGRHDVDYIVKEIQNRKW